MNGLNALAKYAAAQGYGGGKPADKNAAKDKDKDKK